MKYYDTIIVGGGAAALAAAIYAARYGLNALVVEELSGGETALAGPIENYPGFKKIDGLALMEQMKDQATGLGVQFVDGRADLIKNEYHCFQVRVEKTTHQAKTIIIATGMEHRKLGIAREDELKGRGIHYCATCDGPLFKNKIVGVVGGGDSAVKWGSQLSDMGAKEVFMFVREKDLSRAEPINRKRIETKKNVKVYFETEIKELMGKTKLEAVEIASVATLPRKDKSPVFAIPSDARGKQSRIALDGLFVAIGATPRSELPKQLGVQFDAKNQIDVDPRTMQTSVDGVFAAGDVSNASGSFKQIVTAASQGSIAATSAYLDVQTHPAVCELHAVPVAGLLS